MRTFQPVDIHRDEEFDDSARQRIIAELRVEFGKHPSPSTLPPEDPRYIEWAATLVRPRVKQYVRASWRRCLDCRSGPGCGRRFRHRNKQVQRCADCGPICWSDKGLRG